jgi:diketogulonate reductase-like aldo/keto reductase
MPRRNMSFETEQVSLFVHDGLVVSIQEFDGDCFEPVRARIRRGLGRIRERGADYTAYALLDAIESGIATIGYSALMQGLLARPMNSFDGVAPVRLRTRHFASTRESSRHGEAGIESETLEALRAIARIEQRTGRPVAELALAWSVANEAIGCTLVGCRNRAQLEANLRGLARPLEPEIKQDLDQATDEVMRKLGSRIDYFQSEQETRSW